MTHDWQNVKDYHCTPSAYFEDSGQQMYVKLKCPGCRATNWLYIGRPNDPGYCKVGPDACKCYKCAHEFFFVDLDEDLYYSYDLENGPLDLKVLIEKAHCNNGEPDAPLDD